MFSFLELRLVHSLPKYVISDARPGFEPNFKQQPYSEEFVRFEGFEVRKLADNQYFFASLIRAGIITDAQVQAYVRTQHQHLGWLNDLERKPLYHYAVTCCKNLHNADLEQLLVTQLERLARHARDEVQALLEQRQQLNQELHALLDKFAPAQVQDWQQHLRASLPSINDFEALLEQFSSLVTTTQPVTLITGCNAAYPQAVVELETQIYAFMERVAQIFELTQVEQMLDALQRAGQDLTAQTQRIYEYLCKQAILLQELGVVAYTRQSLFFSNSKFFADGYVIHPNQVIVNATVSHLLLYQQVYQDSNIQPRDWVLIADQTLVLAPDWQYRLEKLLERLPQVEQYSDHRSLLSLISLSNKYHNQIAVDQWGQYDLAQGVHYDANEDEQIPLTFPRAGCHGTTLYTKTEVAPADGNQVFARLSFLKSISFSGYSFYMFKRAALKQPRFPAMGIVDAFHQTFELHNGSLGNYQPALGANAYFNETMYLKKEQVDELHLARLHSVGFNYARMAVYRQGYDYLATCKQFVLTPTPSLNAQAVNPYLNSHSLHYYGLFTGSSLRSFYHNWQVVPRYWLVSDLNDSRLYLHADELLDFLAMDAQHFETTQRERHGTYASQLPDSVHPRLDVVAQHGVILPVSAREWQQSQAQARQVQLAWYRDEWGMPLQEPEELSERRYYSTTNFTSEPMRETMQQALQYPTYGRALASLDLNHYTFAEMDGFRLNYPLSRLEAQWYRTYHYTKCAYITFPFGELTSWAAHDSTSTHATHTLAMHVDYALQRGGAELAQTAIVSTKHDTVQPVVPSLATPEAQQAPQNQTNASQLALLHYNAQPRELQVPYQDELTQVQLGATCQCLALPVSASLSKSNTLELQARNYYEVLLQGDRFLGKSTLEWAGQSFLRLQDHHNLVGNLTHRFFSQADTTNFKAFPCNSGYMFAPLGSPAREQGMAHNLSLLFAHIANDQTIDPSDFVLVSQLNTYLSEFWYSKANRLLDYQHLYNRHGQDWDVDVYLLGYEGLEIRREYSSEHLRAVFGTLGDYIDAFNFPKTDLTRFYYGRASQGYNVAAGLQMVTLSSADPHRVQFKLSKAPAFLIRKQAILDNFCIAHRVPLRNSGSTGEFFAPVPLVSYQVDMHLVARWLAGDVEVSRACDPEQRNSLTGKRMLLAVPPLAAFYHPTGIY